MSSLGSLSITGICHDYCAQNFAMTVSDIHEPQDHVKYWKLAQFHSVPLFRFSHFPRPFWLTIRYKTVWTHYIAINKLTWCCCVPMVAILSAELGRLSSRTHSFVSLCWKASAFFGHEEACFHSLKSVRACVCWGWTGIHRQGGQIPSCLLAAFLFCRNGN